MPEGDTVYQLARRLDRSLKGRTLRRAELRVPAHATADLSGRTMLGHDTYGKHLLTRFSGGLTLHTHLQMDGSWTVTRPGQAAAAPAAARRPGAARPARDGSTGYGLQLPVVELVATATRPRSSATSDPIRCGPTGTPPRPSRRLSTAPDRPLVAALLDQRNLAGLGNLWVNELAFLRGYSPWTPMADVDVPATVALAVAGAPALGAHPRRAPGDDRQQPSRGGALGQWPGPPAVPSLRDPDRSRRRGTGGRRTPAHLVVPALSARTGPGPARSRNISLVAEIETAGVVGMIHLASTRR